MNPWFEEKAQQIEPASVRAFGIALASRHAKARELAELLRFAEAAAEAGVNMLIEEAFYDSVSDCCAIALRESARESTAEMDAVFGAAMRTITQFEWEGAVFHGGVPPEGGSPR